MHMFYESVPVIAQIGWLGRGNLVSITNPIHICPKKHSEIVSSDISLLLGGGVMVMGNELCTVVDILLYMYKQAVNYYNSLLL